MIAQPRAVDIIDDETASVLGACVSRQGTMHATIEPFLPAGEALAN